MAEAQNDAYLSVFIRHSCVMQVTTFVACIVTKLGRVMTYGEGNLPMKLHNPLISCSPEVM